VSGDYRLSIRRNILATVTLGYKAMRYNQFNDQIKAFPRKQGETTSTSPRMVRAVSGIAGDRHEAEIEREARPRPASIHAARRTSAFMESSQRKDQMRPVEAGRRQL